MISIVACDNDSNELGSDIIGGNNFETGTPELYDVIAQTLNTQSVETLDLPVNALGVYTNPIFGTLKANLAIQVLMDPAAVNPTFDLTLHPEIESVVLSVPYFSVAGTKDATTEITPYTLDSIHGPKNSKISLKVYESKYYIRDLDASQAAQKYYSNQDQLFDDAKGDQLNTSGDLTENTEFFFNASETTEPGIPTTENQTPDPVRSAPGIKMHLNPAFFMAKIFNAPAEKLLNNNIFKEYLRGLYFHVDNSGADEGNLAMLNIKKGKITIRYKQDKITTTTVNGVTTTTTTIEHKNYILYLTGKSVGLFNTTSTLAQNTDNIYLKGGEGSMAVIDLFGPDTDGDGVADQLKQLRESKWLVNDASLTFHIDNAAMGNTVDEPNRIYLYDFKNKRPLIDYYSDQTSSSKPKYAKNVLGGIIKKTDGRGTSYKIRLTHHIRGLINNPDSTNVRLGLVVTEGISEITNKKLQNPLPLINFTDLPTASIINPFGTILYGSGANVPADKKIQLKIYFTKPKQN